MKCPEEYFDCCEHLNGTTSSATSVFTTEGTTCIPQEWTCDGKRNCPKVCADEDEKMRSCPELPEYETCKPDQNNKKKFQVFVMQELRCFHRLENNSLGSHGGHASGICCISWNSRFIVCCDDNLGSKG